MEGSRLRCMDELSTAFVLKEYADWHGFPSATQELDAIEFARNNPIFHNRVKAMVSRVMCIVDRHADLKEA